MAPYDCLVVGGGVIGAAILEAVARAGHRRTLLLERTSPGSGASGASGAMVRTYHSDAWLNELAAESMARFRAPGPEGKKGCGYVETGALYFDTFRNKPEIEARVAALAAAGVDLEVLDAAAGRARFPTLTWQDTDLAVFEPHAGYVDPKATLKAWLKAAKAQGAEVREGVKVDSIWVAARRIRGVVAGGEKIEARAVVIAAGAWSKPLLAAAGVDIGLFTRPIQTVRVEGTGGPAKAHPCIFDFARKTYGRPDGPGASMVGVSATAQGEDPDTALGPDAADSTRARDLVAQRLPWLAGASMGTALRVLDAYRDGHRPFLGRADRLPGLLIATGMSGTGFKLAPAVGRRIAELVGTPHG